MKNLRTFALIGFAAAMAVSQPMVSYAGQWKQGAGENVNRWWYDNEDNTYASNGWYWLDGNNDGVSECYYFDNNGWLLTNTTTPDGYTVNENGAWVKDGVIMATTIKVNNNKKSTVWTNYDDDSSSKSSSKGKSDSYEAVEDDDKVNVKDLAVDDPERWDYEEAEKFVELLNEYRAKRGYEALELTGGDAEYYANIRSMQLVDNFSHNVDENEYIEKNDYSAEYITINVVSAEDAIRTFKASTKGHWSGLMGLEDVYEFGVGFYRMDNGRYAVSVNANLFNDEGCMYGDYIK